MNIDIISLPIFQGCNIKGVDQAPEVLFEAGALDILKKYHEINSITEIGFGSYDETHMLDSNNNIKYRDEILRLTTKICSKVSRSIVSGNFPISFGGDHSIGTGTIAGNSKAHLGKLSAIWFDAHPDINTPETSPSKNFHGMSFGTAMGYGDELISNVGFKGAKVKSENCYLLGIRSIDEGEMRRIEQNNIFSIKSVEIKAMGAKEAVRRIIEDINSKAMESVHFSIDVDVVTPEDISAVNVPVKRGISIEDALIIIREISTFDKVKSIDFVEYNPLIDTNRSSLSNCLRMVEAISEGLASRGTFAK